MKKQNLFFVLAMMFCLMMGFTACSDDDNKGNNEGGLVNEELPSQKGWSGSLENGQCTYTPEDYTDYPSYFAFSFKNGVCEDAVYNVICDSEKEASSICNLLNNGSFDDFMGDDYSAYNTKATQTSVLSQSLKQMEAIKKVLLKSRVATRADLLGITCSQSGKVVFFKLDCFKGKDGEAVQTAVEVWTVGSMSALPETPLFGTYDRNAGKYTNNNIMGIANTKYEISVKFEEDLLTEFVTTLTLPNPSWALMLEETFQEQAQDYIDMFGEAPEITRNGNTVTVKAIIMGDVPREIAEQYIVILDLTMNMPIGLTLLG